MGRLAVGVLVAIVLVNIFSVDAASRVRRSPQFGVFGVGGVVGGFGGYHPRFGGYHPGYGWHVPPPVFYPRPHGYGGYGGPGYVGPGYGGPGYGQLGYGGSGYGYGGYPGGLSVSRSESLSLGAGGFSQSSASSNAGNFGK